MYFPASALQLDRMQMLHDHFLTLANERETDSHITLESAKKNLHKVGWWFILKVPIVQTLSRPKQSWLSKPVKYTFLYPTAFFTCFLLQHQILLSFFDFKINNHFSLRTPTPTSRTIWSWRRGCSWTPTTTASSTGWSGTTATTLWSGTGNANAMAGTGVV